MLQSSQYLPRFVILTSGRTLGAPLRIAASLALILAAAAGCDNLDSVDVPVSELDREMALSDTSLGGAPPERHCIVQTRAVPAGEIDLALSEPGPADEPECFSRFADAIAFATGEILDGDASPGEYRPQTQLTSSPTAATYVIAMEFTDKYYSGSSYSYTSDKTCSGVTHYKSPVVWNNAISSAKAFSGCNHAYHYDYENFGGAVFDAKAASGDLGALDNRTSSIRWTQ